MHPPRAAHGVSGVPAGCGRPASCLDCSPNRHLPPGLMIDSPDTSWVLDWMHQNSPTCWMRCSKDSASPAFQRYCIQATRHQQREEFLVLEGECHIGTPRLSTGDLLPALVGHEQEEIPR